MESYFVVIGKQLPASNWAQCVHLQG